ncbi:MAG TPA: hypothetical protein VML54_05405 [Candidatus Limnocylindrales bacterium]|nr:hypothetical protein [Candidatus Limnocylindrales bacterium]
MARGLPSGLLILTAVELEAATLARRLELPRLASFPFRAFGRGSLRLAPVGLRAAFLKERWPALAGGLPDALVVSAGVCGGLDPRLRVGDLVVPDCVLGPGGERFDLEDAPARATILAASAGHGGCLATSPEMAATAEAKAALRTRTGAVAVDMESAAILGAARAAAWPALVVRGVSDGAGESLPPELLRLVGADGRVDVRSAMALALTRPGVIGRALGLGRSTRRALETVARALGALTRTA